MLNIATTKNISILRQQPARHRRSIKSTISLQITALHTTLRRYFYQTRSGSGFTRDLITMRTRRTGLVVILRIQRIAEFRAQWRTSSQRSIRVNIVLLQLLSFYHQYALYTVRCLVVQKAINRLNQYLLVELTPTKPILKATLRKPTILQLTRIVYTSHNPISLNSPLIYWLYH